MCIQKSEYGLGSQISRPLERKSGNSQPQDADRKNESLAADNTTDRRENPVTRGRRLEFKRGGVGDIRLIEQRFFDAD